MEKEARKLLEIMDVLVELHKHLLILEEEKIESIINQDWKSVEAILKESELLLSEIEQTERLREKIMNRLGYNSNTPLVNLSDTLPKDIFNQLDSSKKTLEKVILRLKSLNNRTHSLLEDSLEIINFTLSLLSNNGKTTKTYGVSGEEVQENKSTSSVILDIKA